MWGQRTLFVCECEKCDRIHSIESQFSQPCQAKIADRVPYGVRPAVVSAFVECVDALRVAMTTSDTDRIVGAWVVVLRLFHPAVLADRNGGGKAGA